MALLGLDRLEKKDLFTAELWNRLVDILEAKFSSGISESDLAWPLTAQGNIDFGQAYGIVGLRTFWNVVNAAEYASLDAAVSAVEATGGGAVFIPPYTTITATGVSIDASNVTIFGAGTSSVIKITAAATGPLLDTGTSGLSGIRLMNLTLDGTGGGAGCIGVRVRKVARFQMQNVYMTAFTGDFIYITNDGTAGQASTDAYLQGVHCNGGSDSHLVCDDVSGLTVVGCTSKSATGDAISMVPAGSSNLIQDVLLADVRVQSGGAKGIRIIGSGATGIDAHSRIRLSNCHVVGMTGLPYELGNTATLLKDVTVENCFAAGADGDAIRVASNRGVVAGNHVPAAGADAIDITNSVDLWVSGNNCQAAGAYGINADTTTTCTVVGNNCRSAVTDGVNRASSTSLRALENVGDDGPTVANALADFTNYSVAGSGTGSTGFSYVVPANSFKTGDMIRICVFTNSGTSGTVELRAGSTAIASWINNSNNAMVEFLVRPATGGANTNTVRTNVREGVTAQIGTAAAVVDWTVAQTLTFHVTANSGGTNINGIFIDMMGSK